MKKIIASALCLVSFGCQSAMASYCYVLDTDAKRVCLAIERGERSMCFAVINPVERAKCLNLVK